MLLFGCVYTILNQGSWEQHQPQQNREGGKGSRASQLGVIFGPYPGGDTPTTRAAAAASLSPEVASPSTASAAAEEHTRGSAEAAAAPATTAVLVAEATALEAPKKNPWCLIMGNAAPTGEAGFRVLRVHPGTPAETADFELFFDFIIQIDEESLCSPEVSVQSVLKRMDAAEGRPIRLTVYNARHRMNREVYIQPARAASSLILLGVALQFSPFEEALSSPLRVLGVLKNSPAEKAGLHAGTDYILGDDKGAFRGVSDLIIGAEEQLGSSLPLFVFNKETETIRRVVLQPCDNWGGNGCLGCDVGSGFLHRVPFSRAAKDIDAATTTSATSAAGDVGGFPASPDYDAQQQQPQQQQDQLLLQQLVSVESHTDPSATSVSTATAAAAALGMAPHAVSDPATDMLASCLLLPTTNCPLRDPTFPGAQWGALPGKGSHVGSVDPAGPLFSVDSFGVTGGERLSF